MMKLQNRSFKRSPLSNRNSIFPNLRSQLFTIILLTTSLADLRNKHNKSVWMEIFIFYFHLFHSSCEQISRPLDDNQVCLRRELLRGDVLLSSFYVQPVSYAPTQQMRHHSPKSTAPYQLVGHHVQSSNHAQIRRIIHAFQLLALSLWENQIGMDIGDDPEFEK